MQLLYPHCGTYFQTRLFFTEWRPEDFVRFDDVMCWLMGSLYFGLACRDCAPLEPTSAGRCWQDFSAIRGEGEGLEQLVTIINHVVTLYFNVFNE